MKTNLALRMVVLPALLLSTLIHQPSTSFSQGTAFTYQGRLNAGGAPANGSYDLLFTIFDLPTGPGAFANQTNSATAVSNGLFTVTLDFVPGIFTGPERWLEIAVRTNGGGSYFNLVPRQRITAAPYAITAGNLSGSISAGQLSGAIPLAQLPAAVVTNNQSGVSFSGSFSGNAGGLTNVTVNSLVRTTTNSSIVAWGYNFFGQMSVPAGLNNVAAVAAGGAHSLALKSDGTVVAWGNNFYGQTTVPAGLTNVMAVAAGDYHNMALKTDGMVVAWGDNSSGQAAVPAGLTNVAAVAAGLYHSLALKSDGTVVAWGNNFYGQTTVPTGLTNVMAVAAGSLYSLALKSDGMVVAWGNNGNGQTNVPAGLTNVMAVAAGATHSLALKSDGTVVAWGGNGYGQTNVPAGLTNVTAVAAGFYHSLALKSDGTVVAWGYNDDGETTVPAGLNSVIALAQGPAAYHVLVIRGQAYSPVAWLDAHNTFNGNVQINGVATLNNPANSFSGNGAGLTGLNAANVTGTLGTAQIPNLDASKITSGTVADARLSANVALLNANQTFTGNNLFSGTVGIGASSPSKPLVVQKRLQSEPAIMVGGAMPGGPRIQTYGLDADAAAWMGLGTDMGGGPYEHSCYFPVGNNNGRLTIGSFNGTTYSTKLTVDVGGNIRWGNGSLLSSDANGIIELGSPNSAAQQPIIDFHFGVGSVQDYNVRIANDNNETLSLFRASSGTPMARFNSGGLTVNGTFVSASDRSLKENFEAVDTQEILAKVSTLPLSRWNYKADAAQRHLGPMAQDFHAAFHVGPDDKHISTVDEGGVALAAIQGLNEKVEVRSEKAEGRIQKLEAENAELKQRLEKLEQILNEKNGGAKRTTRLTGSR